MDEGAGSTRMGKPEYTPSDRTQLTTSPSQANLDSQDLISMINHENGKKSLFMHLWHFAFSPHTAPIKYWDQVVLLIAIYSSLVIPFKVAFDEKDLEMTWSDWIFDIIFYVDIVAHFWTAYDKGYEMEMRKGNIAKHYLTGWFSIDILGTVEWDLLVHLIFFSEETYVETVDKHPVLKLFKMLKVLRVLRFPRIIDNISQRWIIHSAYVQTIKFFIIVVFTAHILGCLFFLWPVVFQCADWEMWGVGGEPDLNLTLVENRGKCMELSWRAVYSTSNTAVHDMSDFSQYIQALYWSLTTMTTIGYGDRGPQTEQEIVFACVAEIVGLAIFALLLNQIIVLYDAMSETSAEELQTKNEVVRVLRGLHEIDQPMLLRIVEYLGFAKHTYHANRIDFENSSFRHLSMSLRHEIQVKMYLPVINKVQIFGMREELSELFQEKDEDRSGELDRTEIDELLRSIYPEKSTIELDKMARDMLEQMDTSREGTVKFDEFYRWNFIRKYPKLNVENGEPPLRLLQELACVMTSMPFSPHDIVLHPGQFGRDLSILLRGAVVFPQLELPEAHHEVHLAQHGGKLAQKGMKQRCASRAQKGMHKEQVSKSKPARLGGTSGGALIDDVERTPVLDHTKLKIEVEGNPLSETSREHGESEEQRAARSLGVDHKLGPVFGLQAVLPDSSHAKVLAGCGEWTAVASPFEHRFVEIAVIPRAKLRAALREHWPVGLEYLSELARQEYNVLQGWRHQHAAQRSMLDDEPASEPDVPGPRLQYADSGARADGIRGAAWEAEWYLQEEVDGALLDADSPVVGAVAGDRVGQLEQEVAKVSAGMDALRAESAGNKKLLEQVLHKLSEVQDQVHTSV